jgi:hypothetical protein
MKARNLKIEATGDFAAGKVKPRIRLVGQWLERAGFKPGHRVEVRLDEPGKLTLCFCASSGIFRGFFIEQDRGPDLHSGSRCP